MTLLGSRVPAALRVLLLAPVLTALIYAFMVPGYPVVRLLLALALVAEATQRAREDLDLRLEHNRAVERVLDQIRRPLSIENTRNGGAS